MTILYIDTETYSETDLKAGVYNYANHPTTEITLLAWAIDNAPVQVIDFMRGGTLPPEFEAAYTDQSVKVVMHNAQFDRLICNASRHLPGTLAPERICCTMAQALAHGLPGALGTLGSIFGLSEEQAKIKEGRVLVLQFCKPYRGFRTLPKDAPDAWARFTEYARRDVETMRVLFQKLPRWNYPGVRFFEGQPSAEHALWCLDQRINDRGFAIDTELAQAAVTTATDEKALLDKLTVEATSGEVEAATQRDRMLAHILGAHGVTLPDLKQDTVKRRLEDPDLPPAVKELLELRLSAGRSSSAKYAAVLKAVGDDGRLRGTLQYCGAQTTGRWSGRVFQPQNMMRPTLPQAAIDTAIEDIKAGVAGLFYTNLAEVLGNAVRGVIVAPHGRKLVCSDLKSIEGRALAWLAGDERVVQFYRDFDAGLLNYDSYQLAYAQVFGGDPARVQKPERQIGKTIELAFGYGGGVAAYLTFAAVYHLDLDDLAAKVHAQVEQSSIHDQDFLKECADKYDWAKEQGYDAGLAPHVYAAFEYIKSRWRQARQPTVALWNALKDTFALCVEYPRETFQVGDTALRMRRDGQWMRLRLPSGRNIVFLQPQVHDGLSYAGMDRYTRKWGRVFTHGGKLAGICTQALARDVLAANMQPIEDAGYRIVLSIHDELITETPDNAKFSAEGLNTLMATNPPWATGLPLDADGFETYRYRKD